MEIKNSNFVVSTIFFLLGWGGILVTLGLEFDPKGMQYVFLIGATMINVSLSIFVTGVFDFDNDMDTIWKVLTMFLLIAFAIGMVFLFRKIITGSVYLNKTCAEMVNALSIIPAIVAILLYITCAILGNNCVEQFGQIIASFMAIGVSSGFYAFYIHVIKTEIIWTILSGAFTLLVWGVLGWIASKCCGTSDSSSSTITSETPVEYEEYEYIIDEYGHEVKLTHWVGYEYRGDDGNVYEDDGYGHVHRKD